MKLAFFYFLNFFVLAVTAASVGKLNGVSGSVKYIEFDLNSDAFIVSASKFGDRLYKLDYQNQVVFTKDFVSIVYLKFNSKNDVYIFDQVDEKTRMVWVLNSNSFEISNLFNYTTAPDFVAFFDHEDNLFLDMFTGIGVLPNGENTVKTIPRLNFHLGNNTYDVNTNGNIFLGHSMLEKSEIKSADPIPYFFNIDRYGTVLSAKLLNDNLYGCALSSTGITIFKFKDDNDFFIHRSVIDRAVFYCDLYVSNNRIFAIYSENGTCYVQEINSEGHLVDTGIQELVADNTCNFYRTSDKYGTVYFGRSDYGSSIHYIKINDGTKHINIPNSIYIFGLVTSDSGSLWILSQDLYLVPFGQTEAVKIKGLPYLKKSWPFKAKPGSNDVFIGSDNGVYIGSI